MFRLLFQIVFACTLLASIEPAVLACKYSVRDVGFVDIESSPYRLIVGYEKGTPERVLRSQQAEVTALLNGANIKAEWLEVRPGAESSDLDRYLSSHQDAPVNLNAPRSQEEERKSDRVLCLVSPDQRRLNLGRDDIDQEDLSPDAERARLIESVRSLTDSPLRNQILTRLLASHSVLLLVEGDDPVEDRNGANLAQQAIDRVTQSLPSLPKAIKNPPVLIRLSHDEALREQVLCWSLGLNLENGETQIAVLFGRGRIMGVPMRFPESSLEDILLWQGYVGQDCECELDRAVMQGPMFPHRWDSKRESEAVKHLDFDPGSPLVKAEIARILQHNSQPGPRNLGVGISAADDSLDMYRSVAIEVSPLDGAKEGSPIDQDAIPNRQEQEKQGSAIESVSDLTLDEAISERAGDPLGAEAEREKESERTDQDSSPWTFTGLSLGGIGLAAFALGGWFLFRNSQGA